MTLRIARAADGVREIWRIEQRLAPPWWAPWRGPRWRVVWLPPPWFPDEARRAEYVSRATAERVLAKLRTAP